MKIHADLLTHNGTLAADGKVLDLGFDGDFDHKNHSWNMIFVHLPKNTGEAATAGATVTVKVSSTTITVADMTTIGTFTIPVKYLNEGGAIGVPMPRGMERYFTLTVTGAPATSMITAGITDEVDTDIIPGVDWTYYKADTSTSLVEGTMSKAIDGIFG